RGADPEHRRSARRPHAHGRRDRPRRDPADRQARLDSVDGQFDPESHPAVKYRATVFTLTTLTVAEKVVHTTGLWMFTEMGIYVSSETNNKQSANQLRLAGRVDYALDPRLSVFVGATTERNKFAGFERRTDEIAGVAWK